MLGTEVASAPRAVAWSMKPSKAASEGVEGCRINEKWSDVGRDTCGDGSKTSGVSRFQGGLRGMQMFQTRGRHGQIEPAVDIRAKEATIFCTKEVVKLNAECL
jgi:hypothetical protein